MVHIMEAAAATAACQWVRVLVACFRLPGFATSAAASDSQKNSPKTRVFFFLGVYSSRIARSLARSLGQEILRSDESLGGGVQGGVV